MENENLTQTQREIGILKNILKIYFLVVLVFYITLVILKYLNIEPNSSMSISMMYAIFGTPLIGAAIYFLRSIYSLWQKNWELFKLSIMNMVIGLIVGAGICGSNLYMFGMSGINY